MALVVITVTDSADGVQVGVVCEPAMPSGDEPRTPAHTTAVIMLESLEKFISKDAGLIQLIN